MMRAIAAALALLCAGRAAELVSHPFPGVTSIVRTEAIPRKLSIHVVEIDLTAPGIAFHLTPPGGPLETLRQTTLEFLGQEHAQVAINAHFFLPFPSTRTEADLIGLAASNGNVFSGFETPAQSYAIVDHAPAINISADNRAGIVHWDRRFSDGKHVIEDVRLWNAVSGSAQIVTGGASSIPTYSSSPDALGLLIPGGPRNYSQSNSWYDALQARSAIGLSQDNRTVYLFTVDRAEGSLGMRIGEVADLLVHDYAVYNALNLDGGGSTSLAMEDPVTHTTALINHSSDRPEGRAVGSSLAVFARPSPAAGR